MRTNLRSVPLPLVLLLTLTAPATAQLGKTRSYIDTVKSAGETLEYYNRKPYDEPRIYAALRQMRDACKNGSDTITGFGDPLAAAAASPHEERLKEPAKLAKALAYELGERGAMIEKCDQLTTLINTELKNRPGDWQTRMETTLIGLIAQSRARVKDIEDLARKSDETMRWLRESLQTAQVMNEDASRPGAALDAAKQQVVQKHREQGYEVRRQFDALRDLQEREVAAGQRFVDARNEHEAARKAPPSSSYTSNATNAYRKWVAAELDHKEATRRLYDGYAQMERTVGEVKARVAELANLMSELEKFQANANPETIGKRLTDFDQWTKLFERELSR